MEYEKNPFIGKIDEIKSSDWYKERPEVIKKAMEILPINKYYSLNGKQCFIVSFTAKDDDPVENVTVRVQKTGKGGAMDEMGLSALDRNQVFGIKIDDLKEWKDENK